MKLRRLSQLLFDQFSNVFAVWLGVLLHAVAYSTIPLLDKVLSCLFLVGMCFANAIDFDQWRSKLQKKDT